MAKISKSTAASKSMPWPPSEIEVSVAASDWDDLLENIRGDAALVEVGGGPKATERQHKKKRLSARERIELLKDPGTGFFELGGFAAWNMYTEWGGAPAAGVVTGVIRIEGRLAVVIANDATVKAGAFFPMTAKKVLRAQRIAMDNHLPLVYLVDSAGVFLPLQDEIFPDEDDFGRIFRNNAKISAQGIPQLAAIMGNCVAGGAYLPVMCDKVVMTEGSGLYIAGPALVKAAIGQNLSSDEIGGADLHASLSGTIDFKEATDEAALKRLRSLAAHWPPSPQPVFRRESSRNSECKPTEMVTALPVKAGTEYDPRDVLRYVVDKGSFDEYKKEFGRSLICGTARIDGWSVGIVANQKMHIKEPGRPFELGGVIYPESADKAARFVMDCNQNRIPLIFFHDVNGFMVGPRAEINGIIRSGAKLVNAMANSVVPKFTVILGGSFGAGHYALCGKAYDPRMIVALPTCSYSVMGGAQAARTLLDLKVNQLRKKGLELNEEELEKLRTEILDSYGEQTDPRYAAARLWVDAIIDPARIRSTLALGLEMAAQNTEVSEYKLGVFQV